MLVQTRYRSSEKEIMDDFLIEGDMLLMSLDQIGIINKRLGGNSVTLQGLRSLYDTEPKNSVIKIIDIGCGSGELLRMVADYGRKNNFIFKLMGIDANKCTVNYARELSTNYPEISYANMDVQAVEFSALEYDIALATLFLHHFTVEEIENLLTRLVKQSRIGIVINDLQRSRYAYYLFKLISIFIKNPMTVNDGAISVLRGFKKKELIQISSKLTGTTSSVEWKWAFRYQWIIKKL